MSARLEEDGDKLVVKIFGDDFHETLESVKRITGRRYNPENKTWELPNDLETLLKAVHTLQPQLPAFLQGKIKEAKAKMAAELVTKLPDDAILDVPWAGPRSWGARTVPEVGQRWLEPKQRSGVWFLSEHPHSLLADEMGSGKTIQAISTVFQYLWTRFDDIEEKFEGRYKLDGAIVEPKVIVVCPNSVTDVWVQEIEKWTGAKATVIDAKTKPKRLAQLEESGEWVVVNWEKLRIMPELAKLHPIAVIADESHRAKNKDAQQTKALWKLKAPVHLALTGTPVMNDPGELWAQLRWLRPEQYKSYYAFFYNYTDFYTGHKGKPVVLGVQNADALRFELADKMVRRTKREIHKDIPHRLETQYIDVAMKPKQQKLYDEAVDNFWLEVAQEAIANVNGTDPMKPTREGVLAALGESDKISPQTLTLLIPNAGARTTRLRQIATSPALLGGPDESGKLDALIDTIKDAEHDRPFVVFTWFRDTVTLLLNRLEKAKITADGFTGDTPAGDRAPKATAFQNGEYQVIVATIATGGTGINLFRSSDPMFAEQAEVPALNNQAIDRTDRKGQKNPVLPRVFRSANSADVNRIAPKLGTKELIVTSILGADN